MLSSLSLHSLVFVFSHASDSLSSLSLTFPLLSAFSFLENITKLSLPLSFLPVITHRFLHGISLHNRLSVSQPSGVVHICMSHLSVCLAVDFFKASRLETINIVWFCLIAQ